MFDFENVKAALHQIVGAPPVSTPPSTSFILAGSIYNSGIHAANDKLNDLMRVSGVFSPDYVRFLLEIIAYYPRDTHFLMRLGRVLEHFEQVDLAKNVYEEIRKINPSDKFSSSKSWRYLHAPRRLYPSH